MTKFANKINVWRSMTACALSFFCTACAATSRMETAIISLSQGLPCFSIPENAETKNGIPLYGIQVTEIKAKDWKSLPDSLWSFSVKTSNRPILLRPGNCIRYGDTPALATQGALKELKPFHVYSVGITARPIDSNVVAYGARFCLKPASDGNVEIQLLAPNSSQEDKRCSAK